MVDLRLWAEAVEGSVTGNELFDTAEGIRTGSRRMKKTLVPRALVTISANK